MKCARSMGLDEMGDGKTTTEPAPSLPDTGRQFWLFVVTSSLCETAIEQFVAVVEPIWKNILQKPCGHPCCR